MFHVEHLWAIFKHDVSRGTLSRKLLIPGIFCYDHLNGSRGFAVHFCVLLAFSKIWLEKVLCVFETKRFYLILFDFIECQNILYFSAFVGRFPMLFYVVHPSDRVFPILVYLERHKIPLFTTRLSENLFLATERLQEHLSTKEYILFA